MNSAGWQPRCMRRETRGKDFNLRVSLERKNPDADLLREKISEAWKWSHPEGRRKKAHAEHESAQEVWGRNLGGCRVQRRRLRWDWWLPCPRGLTMWRVDRTAFGRQVCVELPCRWGNTDLNQGSLQLPNGLLQAVQPLEGEAPNIFTCFSLVLNEDTVVRVRWVLTRAFHEFCWDLGIVLISTQSLQWRAHKYLFSGYVENYGQFRMWTKTPAGLVDIYFLDEQERRLKLRSYSGLWWDDQSLQGFTPAGLQQRKSLSLQVLSRAEQPSLLFHIIFDLKLLLPRRTSIKKKPSLRKFEAGVHCPLVIDSLHIYNLNLKRKTIEN